MAICKRLSDKCYKAAIQDPQGCKTKAVEAAKKDCKLQTGVGLAGCMDHFFHIRLAEYCGKLVCPSDPFMCKEIAQATTIKTTSARAEEGGGFSQNVAELMQQTNNTAAESGGGISASKMRTYVLGGLVVLTVLAIAVGKKG